MTMTEEHQPTTAALVPQVVAGGQTLVRPIAAESEVVEAFNAYQHLCETLLTPGDHQGIGGKQFRKKSAWRKLAVAMGVSAEIIDRSYEREGRRIIRAEIVVRATAPNGRSWEGLGACDLYEKCCVQPCSKARFDSHKCCPPDCSGAVHFSNPQHDLPATAATRATNRACADLFGFGEVSAEEIVDRGPTEQPMDEHEQLGWRSKRDHDAARAELVALLRAQPPEMQQRFRAWRTAQGIDIQYPVSVEQMELATTLARALADGSAVLDEDGNPGPAKVADPAPAEDEAPTMEALAEAMDGLSESQQAWLQAAVAAEGMDYATLGTDPAARRAFAALVEGAARQPATAPQMPQERSEADSDPIPPHSPAKDAGESLVARAEALAAQVREAKTSHKPKTLPDDAQGRLA